MDLLFDVLVVESERVGFVGSIRRRRICGLLRRVHIRSARGG
jgi:hypothetical protein